MQQSKLASFLVPRSTVGADKATAASSETTAQGPRKREDNSQWDGDTAYQQGQLRGLKWKRQGIGYQKKADFIARVKAYDQGLDEALSQASQAESESNASQGEESSTGAGVKRMKYHTTVSKKKRKVQLQGVCDAQLWEDSVDAEVVPFVPPLSCVAVRKERAEKDTVAADRLGLG